MNWLILLPAGFVGAIAGFFVFALAGSVIRLLTDDTEHAATFVGAATWIVLGALFAIALLS